MMELKIGNIDSKIVLGVLIGLGVVLINCIISIASNFCPECGGKLGRWSTNKKVMCCMGKNEDGNGCGYTKEIK